MSSDSAAARDRRSCRHRCELSLQRLIVCPQASLCGEMLCDSTVYDSAIHPQNVRGPPRALAARPTVAHVVAGGPVNRPPYVTAAVVETCARNSQSTKKRAFRQRTPEDTLYPHSDREDAFSRARPPPWSASNPARRHSTRNAPRNDRTGTFGRRKAHHHLPRPCLHGPTKERDERPPAHATGHDGVQILAPR